MDGHYECSTLSRWAISVAGGDVWNSILDELDPSCITDETLRQSLKNFCSDNISVASALLSK